MGFRQKFAKRLVEIVDPQYESREFEKKSYDLEKDFLAHFDRCKAFTSASVDRCYASYCAVRYADQNKLPGSVVECGVWRGGSSMIMMLSHLESGNPDREFYLYDTYTGMTEPTDKDLVGRSGAAAIGKWKQKNTGDYNDWCYAPLDDVKTNVRGTGFPEKQIRFVKGPVEDTIPETIPDQIAVLRLDTDWYESTKHELNHLYPRLVPGGVLLIDDYGYWQGARAAVDEYFQTMDTTPMLFRTDVTGRACIKR